MQATPRIRTERLELIPATGAMLASDRGDRAELGRLLDSAIPASWPPPLLDEDTLAGFVLMQSEGSDPNFCCWYWVLIGPGPLDRTLIGSGGTGSYPGKKDAVSLGYSVLPEFQNRGYATEAVRHLVQVIFSHPGIRRIVATTYPDLPASIRVLERSGFLFAGTTGGGRGMEEGTLLYLRERGVGSPQTERASRHEYLPPGPREPQTNKY